MRIRVWSDSGANIKSTFEEEIDTDELGYDTDEWKELSENDRLFAVKDYLEQRGKLDYGYENLG